MSVRAFSLLLIAACFCGSYASAGEAPPIRVVCFNLRGDFDDGATTDKPHAWLSTTGEHRRDASMRLVRRFDADLLGVQEACPNQVEDLRAALPTHDDEGVGRDDGAAAGEHCSIFFRRERFERIDGGTFWLSPTPDTPSLHPDATYPRIATWVRLRDRLADRPLLVLNTHWAHFSAEARLAGARLIRERLPRLAAGAPIVVMGDLNALESSEPLRVLRAAESATPLVDSYRVHAPQAGAAEATFHDFTGATTGRRIDYLLHTNDFVTREAAIVRDRIDGRWVSDHFPVSAVLAWASDE